MLAAVKPVEGVVNKLLLLVILAFVAWLGLRIWKRRQSAD